MANTGGLATIASGGWLQTASGMSGAGTVGGTTTDMWSKTRFKVDTLRGLATSSQMALEAVGALTSVSADKWDVGAVGVTGSKYQLKAVYDNNGVSVLSSGSDLQSALPANGNYLVLFVWYSTTLGTCGFILFDDSGNQYGSGSGTATVALSSGSTEIAIGDCNIVGFDANAGMVAQGTAWYNSVPPTSGATRYNPPATTDTGLIYLAFMNDATGSTSAAAQVGSVALGDNGTVTYSGPNNAAGLWGPPPVTIPVTIALAGMGSIAATMQQTLPSTAALAGMGSIGASSTETLSSSAGLAGMGSMVALTTETISGPAALAGGGSLNGAVQFAIPITIALAGMGSVGGGLTLIVPVQINLFGSGSIGGAGAMTWLSTAGLAGGGSLQGAAVVIVPLFVSVQLAGGGSIVASGSVVLPATASTPLLVQAIRNQLIRYIRWDGANLAAMLSNPDLRLYENQAPDGVPYPYGTIRLRNRTNRLRPKWRQNFDVEINFFARPRSQSPFVEICGDIAESAMLSWIEPSSGVHMQDVRRETILFDHAPADREIAREQLIVSGYAPILYLMGGGDIIP
jgi:hypothetical protein